MEFTVDSSLEGERLDKCISQIAGISRSRAKKAIEDERVHVSSEYKSAHYTVREGDIIQMREKKRISDVEKVEMPLRILYEDEHLIVVDKEAGLVVHPAPGCKDPTLLNGLKFRYSNPEIVHRLDMDTSGVLIVALNEVSALEIRKQFKSRTVKKHYLALVSEAVKPEEGNIDFPIRRSRRNPSMMSVGWASARKSSTDYKVVEIMENITLVSAFPKTGRTHQIRVHFSHLGHPLLGDTKYGGSREDAPRQMLHAYEIEFTHPLSGEIMSYRAPVPEDFKKALLKRGFKFEKHNLF